MKQFLETTKNHVKVYVSEETMAHMQAHADVDFTHIKEALKKVSLRGSFFMEEVNLKNNVGKDHCIYVPSERWNEVQMVQRPNRQGLTPMIQADPEDTSLLTIGVCLDDDGLWTMFTAFYGVKAPKEPWDPRLTEAEKTEAETFWSCHALCM